MPTLINVPENNSQESTLDTSKALLDENDETIIEDDDDEMHVSSPSKEADPDVSLMTLFLRKKSQMAAMEASKSKDASSTNQIARVQESEKGHVGHESSLDNPSSLAKHRTSDASRSEHYSGESEERKQTEKTSNTTAARGQKLATNENSVHSEDPDETRLDDDSNLEEEDEEMVKRSCGGDQNETVLNERGFLEIANESRLDDSILTADMMSRYNKGEATHNDTTLMNEDSLLDVHDSQESEARYCVDRSQYRATARKAYSPGSDDRDDSFRQGDFEPISFERQPGKNELKLRSRFLKYVSENIDEFKQLHPGRLKEYKTMSSPRKEQELRKARELLSRLRVPNSYSQSSAPTMAREKELGDEITATAAKPMEQEETKRAPAIRLDESRNETFQYSAPADDSSFREAEVSPISNCGTAASSVVDTSMALLSPADSNEGTTVSKEHRDSTPRVASLRSPPPGFEGGGDDASFGFRDDDDDSSSVEIARRARRESSMSPESYDTPQSTSRPSQKRPATTSGKRGTDVYRFRMSADSFNSIDASDPRPSEIIASPSQLNCSSLPSPDEGGPVFTASQSPILYRATFQSDSEDDPNSGYSSRDLETPRDGGALDDTIQTIDCTIAQRRRVQFEDKDPSYLQEIPANVTMKDGVAFRMKPLRIKRSRKHRSDPQLSFPDPLDAFPGRLGRKLNSVFEQLSRLDQAVLEDSNPKRSQAVVFSMNMEQIAAVSVKLLLSTRHESQYGLQSQEKGNTKGGTLVICRSKEDLEIWEKALRVGTSHSVMNHSALALSERTRVATAQTCSNYDVILTTYDAIASKDVAIPLNEHGHAQTSQTPGPQNNGWMASRTGGASQVEEAPLHCEKLSILHMLEWRRILFIDVLGRKSFTAKLSTRRAKSCVGLNGASRFIFFCGDENSKATPVEVLRKSNRHAFQSVSNILRISQEWGEECMVSDCFIDLADSRA